MSNQWPGGFITKTPPSVSQSSAPGMWTLSQQAAYQKVGQWPVPGPVPISLNVTYQNTNYTSTGTIFTRNITQDGIYTIYVEGAAGRTETGADACAGRRVIVTCVLLNGQTLYMLPGTQGGVKGGGGGSFLMLGSGTGTPICGAGGGGGRDNSGACNSTTNGQPVTSNGAGGTSDVRNYSNDGFSYGGVNGNGSTILGSPARIGGGAGGGLYTSGIGGLNSWTGGTSYASGGNGGGIGYGYPGGFGGGGSGDNSGGGGAGGYSGGGGIWDTSTGGGGGSWVTSTLNGYAVTYVDSGAVITGNGRIYIA